MAALHARWVFGRRVNAIGRELARLVPSNSVSVLDMGCGDGSVARVLQQQRPELKIRGLEIQLRPQCAIAVEQYDGTRAMLDDRSQDVVVLVDVLHHASDPAALLGEATRLARHAVIIKDHLTDPFLGRLRLRLMDWFGNTGHGVELRGGFLSRAQWQQAFAQCDLRLLVWDEDLGLYPRILRPLLESGLHFAALLEPDRR